MVSHFRQEGYTGVIPSPEMLFDLRYYPSKSVRCLKPFAVDLETGSDWRVLSAEVLAEESLRHALPLVMANRERLASRTAMKAKGVMGTITVFEDLPSDASDSEWFEGQF
jgi:hypothetical protein